MCRALVLIPSIILAALAFTTTGRSTRSSDCPVLNCSYLPLIGNPPPVVVFEIYQWPTRAGTYRFIGDVIAFKPVYDVVVEVLFFDGDYKNAVPVVLKASLPGQLNPFDIVTNIPYGITPFEVNVIDWKVESEQIYRKATIVSISYEDDTAGTLVTAEVRNDEASPLLNVEGVIWGWYQDFRIEAVDLADSLAPGETATFSEYLRGTHYIPYIHVSAQGVLQP